MKASKFLFLTVIALAVMAVSGCEEEDGPLKSVSNTPPSMNSDQDLKVPKDRLLPIGMIQEVSKREYIQQPVDVQRKEFSPVSENNYLHAVK